MSINDQPLGKRITKATKKPSIQPGAQEFKEFAVTKNDLLNGSDLFKCDKPQISLRIMSFSGTTLVSLVWTHSAMDPAGFQALLKNWSLVMAGRESEVLPVGARENMVYDIVKPCNKTKDIKQKKLHVAQKRISGFKLVLFDLRFGWGLVWQGACQSKSIFLPREAVANLMRQAPEEITITTLHGDENPFLSEGDVFDSMDNEAHRIIRSPIAPSDNTYNGKLEISDQVSNTNDWCLRPESSNRSLYVSLTNHG